MQDSPIKVLMIEDHPGDVRLVKELLGDVKKIAGGTAFDLESVDTLSEGLERVSEGGIDLVLLDLHLPDSQGLETVKRFRAGAPNTAVVVMTSLDDPDVGFDAVQAGAQEYLVKGRVDSEVLSLVMNYALELKWAGEVARRAIADAQEQPEERVGGLRVYKLIDIRSGTVFTTREGRHYALTIHSADEKECELEYVPVFPDRSDDPAVVMKAFADALNGGRYEDAVKFLSREWVDVWGLSLGESSLYGRIHSILWRATREEGLSDGEIKLLDGFAEQAATVRVSPLEVRGDRAAVAGTESWFLLAKAREGWRIAMKVAGGSGMAKNAFLQRRTNRDNAWQVRATTAQFLLHMAARRYKDAAAMMLPAHVPCEGVFDNVRRRARAIERAGDTGRLSGPDGEILRAFERGCVSAGLPQTARANTLENFGYVFRKALEDLFIDRMEQNEEIAAKFMNEKDFQKIVGQHLMEQVYDQIRAESTST